MIRVCSLGRRALAAGALALSVVSAYAQSVPIEAAEGGNLWFVELAGAPEADGNTRVAVRSEKEQFKRSAAAAGVRYRERRAFDVLFNGFSVEATAAERSKLARLPGFKAMYPVETIHAPLPENGFAGSALDLAAAVAMTRANIVQANGWTGAGIKVGIIDTGIDIDHPALGGGGVPGATPFPSARVAFGYDLVGDAFNGSAGSVPVPDGNPDDCAGHGTHVAGIVGASSATVRGVAPGVTFGAYRVFGCTGSTTADIMLEALERALADGMQIVNMSIGASRQWPQYPTAVTSSRLAKRGVVVVASIGNSGPGGSPADGLYAAGAPGVGAGVIGVASFDNFQRSFTVNATPYGFNPASGVPLPPTSGSLPMTKTGTPTTANDGCAALPAASLSGRAVLIRRGTCGFFVKASNAQAAGAAAVVLYNNAAGALNANAAGVPALTIAVVGITAAQGAALDALIAAGPTSLVWADNYVGYPFGTGGLMSSFSSFGLAADLSLKPNIGAPGGGIFSTYPLEIGGFATLSGTSMSSPHVAGAAALLLEARPNTRPSMIKTLMQNSADPKVWGANPALGFLDNVHRQGAGMLDIAGAIDAKATVVPSEIALGESEFGAAKHKLRIKSRGNASATYDISHQPALATGPFTFVQAPGMTFHAAPASVTFDRTTVTVGADDGKHKGSQGKDDDDDDGDKSAHVYVTITAPDSAVLADRGLYGGYIVLTPRDGGEVLRVPFAGFKGDYQAIRVLEPTANGFPWLASASGASYVNRPAGATYTLIANDIPYFLMHLDHHSEMVLLEALDAATDKVRGRVSLDEWVTRNSSPGGFFAFTWDGDVFKRDPSKPNQWSTLENGQYKVRVTVKKALAERKNADHFETWTSPVITLARP